MTKAYCNQGSVVLADCDGDGWSEEMDGTRGKGNPVEQEGVEGQGVTDDSEV